MWWRSYAAGISWRKTGRNQYITQFCRSVAHNIYSVTETECLKRMDAIVRQHGGFALLLYAVSHQKAWLRATAIFRENRVYLCAEFLVFRHGEFVQTVKDLLPYFVPDSSIFASGFTFSRHKSDQIFRP